MSQYNQITPQSNNPGKKSNSIIYWVVILVLLVGCIYMFWKNKQDNTEATVKQEQLTKTIDSVKTDRASLQADFDAASAKIDQLVTQNSKLDSALQGDKVAMGKLQAQIKTILSNKNATQAELNRAREMITQLTDKSKHYEARIAELEKENTQLTGQNKVLTKERDSTVQKNIELKKVGSVLHASNIRMEAIHKRRNGKEKETSKAKRADVLRIAFDIDENRIAESGTKQIYLRIVGPDGNILSTPSNSSGNMTTATGSQVSYSVMKDIVLTQNQPVKNITIDWQQDGNYNRGTYNIEIYNEGYKVGSGNVELK